MFDFSSIVWHMYLKLILFFVVSGDLGSQGSTTITVSSDFSPLVSRASADTPISIATSLNNLTTSLCNIVPGINSSVSSIGNQSLILTDGSVPEDLTVCQYIIPADILGKLSALAAYVPAFPFVRRHGNLSFY